MSATRLLSMLSRVRGMSVSSMGVVRGFLVAASVIMLRSLLVVLRRMAVMFRCLAVVVGSFL